MDTPRKINGMQKFYSKIMHKIEDFPPKLQLKLTKAIAKEERKERDSSCDGVNNNENVSKCVATPQRPPRLNKRQRSASHEPPYENVMVRSVTKDDGDASEDTEIKHKTYNISLEDEIFEELEKVAHDEQKLNAVIQNFDKILLDYNNDRSISEAIESSTLKTHHKSLTNSTSLPLSLPLSVAPPLKNQKSNMRIFCPPPLQKAKTCSIIESKCILKKNVGILTTPEPSRKKPAASSHEDELDKYVQITKSLMNLHDLNELAKKLDKHETERLKRDAIQFSNYDTYKVAKHAPSSSDNSVVAKDLPPVEIMKKQTKTLQVSQTHNKMQSSNSCGNISRSIEKLPIIVTNMEKEEASPASSSTSTSSLMLTKTKSVCELSRNNSGSLSKIPVKAQQLKYYGPQTAIVKPLSVHSSRSSSYIDMPSAIPLIATSSSFVNGSSNDFSGRVKAASTKNLSIPLKPLSHQVPTINVPMTMMMGVGQQKGGVKKSIMKNAVSTSAINKQIPQNRPLLLSTSPTKPRMKSAVSDLSLNKTNTSIKRAQPVDASRRLQNGPTARSTEKRLSILKKAQELKTAADDVDFARISSGNVTTGDNSQNIISSTKRDFVLKSGKQTIKKSHTSKINGTSIISNTQSTGNNNNRTNILTKSTKATPPKPRTRTILPTNQSEIVSLANTTTVVKTLQSEKDKKQSSIEELAPNNNDRAYQSDCSDDSGHISNEADDNVVTTPILLTTTVQNAEQQHAKSKSELKSTANNSGKMSSKIKTGRISEALLEKFEANQKLSVTKSANNRGGNNKNKRSVKSDDKSIKRIENSDNKDTKLELIKCNKSSVGVIMDDNKNLLGDEQQLIDVYLNTADSEVR